MEKRTVIILLCLIVLSFMLLPGQGRAAGTADKKIGLMWVGESGMQNRVFRGFYEKMKVIAPEVDIETRINLPDMETAIHVFHDFENNKDGIVFLRSTGARFLGWNPSTVPCFFGGCNNPVFLGAVKNMGAPEGNVTGVTYYIPKKKIFPVIELLFPGIKSLGLLLEKGHPSTIIDQLETIKECQKRDIQYREAICSSRNELAMAVKKMREEVDLLILSNSALALDNAKMVVTVAGRTPVFSYVEKAVKRGAVAGLVPDDVKLGRLLAESVVAVVVKGKVVKDVPVKTDPHPRLLLNRQAMKRWGITLSEALKGQADFVD